MNEELEYYALIERAFNLLAPVYNLMTVPLGKVRHQVVDFSDARANSTILDVATGTGQQAFAFAKAGCDVTAVDLTESMLAIAHKHNLDGKVNFEAGDATRLRFEDESFEITCISFALHDMPLTIRRKVLLEMVRVTRPGGSIVIVDYALPRNRLGRSLFYRLITLYEGEYYKKFIESDLEGLIKAVGIEIIAQRSFLLGAGRMLKGIKPNILAREPDHRKDR